MNDFRPIIVEKASESRSCCINTSEQGIAVYQNVVEITYTDQVCGFREQFRSVRLLRDDIVSLDVGGGRDPKLALLVMLISLLAIGVGIFLDDEALSIYIYTTAGSLFLASFTRALCLCFGGEHVNLTIGTSGMGNKSYTLKLNSNDAMVVMDVLFPLARSNV